MLIKHLTILPLFLFCFTEPKYVEEEARVLLNLSAASYGLELSECLNRTFRDVRKYKLEQPIRANCDNIGTICQSFVVVSEVHKKIYVVFKGSRSLRQIILEGWDQLVKLPFFDIGTVNSYFLNAHNVLWDRIESVMNAPQYRNYRVVFTGHSLGGALASLAAARTVRNGYRSGEQVKLVTFGQPRVGDFKFAMKFDELIPESYRVVNRHDIVPHLPACHRNRTIENPERFVKPCAANTGMYHHGTEIWYPNGMGNAKFVECRGWPRNEDVRCSNGIRFRYSHLAEYIWDHRHYFTIRVVQYGQNGCERRRVEPLEINNSTFSYYL